MKNYFTERFLNNREEFPITDIITGLNSLITDESQLAFDLGTNTYNLRNVQFDNVNNQIKFNTYQRFNLKIEAFESVDGTPRQQLLADNLLEMDLSKINFVGGRKVHKSSITSFKHSSLTSVGAQALENMRFLTTFEAPNIKNLYQRSLNRIGEDNGGIVIPIDLSKVERLDYSSISGNFKTISDWNNVTYVSPRFFEQAGSQPNTGWRFQEHIPFDLNIIPMGSPFPRLFFRKFEALKGSLSLPMYQGPIKYDSLNDMFEIEQISLPEATEITTYSSTDNRRGFKILSNLPKLTLLDIKKVNSIPTYNPTKFFNNFGLNGTLNIHVDLKDYDNSGSIHPRIENLINNYGWTVNWYNTDGTFNSTTN